MVIYGLTVKHAERPRRAAWSNAMQQFLAYLAVAFTGSIGTALYLAYHPEKLSPPVSDLDTESRP
jgi:hypothetical protein